MRPVLLRGASLSVGPVVRPGRSGTFPGLSLHSTYTEDKGLPDARGHPAPAWPVVDRSEGRLLLSRTRRVTQRRAGLAWMTGPERRPRADVEVGAKLGFGRSRQDVGEGLASCGLTGSPELARSGLEVCTNVETFTGSQPAPGRARRPRPCGPAPCSTRPGGAAAPAARGPAPPPSTGPPAPRRACRAAPPAGPASPSASARPGSRATRSRSWASVNGAPGAGEAGEGEAGTGGLRREGRARAGARQPRPLIRPARPHGKGQRHPACSAGGNPGNPGHPH